MTKKSQASPEELNEKNKEDQSNLDRSNNEKENFVNELISKNETLQNEMESMKSSMAQMTKMLQTLMSRPLISEETIKTQDIKKTTIPNFDNSLMVETAKRLKETAPIEKDAPFLNSVAEIDWKKFVPKYKEYKSKNGSRTLFELIKDDPRIFYQDQIEDPMKYMDCKTLFDTINEINGTELDATGIFRSSTFDDQV